MIAKGNLHGHGAKLAAYLTTSSADERAELIELRGFMATSIRDAFIDVMIQAEGTRAEKPFFHAYVRAPAGEPLARETWLAFADRLERRLGFAGQPRAISFHHQADGESHMHVAWSRIDLETLRAIDPGLYKAKMKQLCREFEREHGLTLVPNERQADQKTRAAERGEFEQARRLKTDLKAIRNAIHDAWQKADTGQAFAAALDEAGLILARGDRRDFVVIDRAGGDHALSKRITGATASETRQRLADIDRGRLPSVADAKALQKDRQAARESASRSSPRPRAAAPVRIIGGIARPAAPARGLNRSAGNLLRGAGKLAEGVSNALEGLLGGGPAKPARSDDKRPLDAGSVPSPAETAKAREIDETDRSRRRQRFLREFSREVPDGQQQEAELERDRRGRERER